MNNNALKVFENNEFGSVRAMLKDGEPWFVASDVCKALGLRQVTRAMDRLDADEGGLLKITHPQNAEKTLEVNGVNESGLYHLILCSTKPEAKAFKRWVTHEVIPSIRKHGAYLTDEATDKLFQDPDTFARLAVAWRDEARLRREAEAKIEADKPKVLLADSITESKTDILIGELAKILKQNGVKTGQNRLFERLRQDGYLVSREGLDYNMPTQKSMELGLMRVKEGTFTGHSNNVYVTKTVRITGKGQLYFVNKYAGKAAQ